MKLIGQLIGYMAHQTAPLLMTLSDLQSHSPIASLLTCNFSYSYAAVEKISTGGSCGHPLL